MVVVFWAATGGRPLGAAVLFGLFQELVQTEGILFKLNWSFPSVSVVSASEVFVGNKSAVGEKNKKNMLIYLWITKWPEPNFSNSDLLEYKLTEN